MCMRICRIGKGGHRVEDDHRHSECGRLGNGEPSRLGDEQVSGMQQRGHRGDEAKQLDSVARRYAHTLQLGAHVRLPARDHHEAQRRRACEEAAVGVLDGVAARHEHLEADACT